MDNKIMDALFGNSGIVLSREELEAAERDIKSKKNKARDGNYYRALTEILIRLNKADEAIEILSAAMETEPDATGLLSATLGAALMAQRKLPESIAAYTAALLKSPAHLGWLYRLALAEYLAGNIREARKALFALVSLMERKGLAFNNKALLIDLAWQLFDLRSLAKLGLDPPIPAKIRRILKQHKNIGSQLKPFILQNPEIRLALQAEFIPQAVASLRFYKNAIFTVDTRRANLTVEGGIRVTPGNPAQYDKTIYLFGPSTVFGAGPGTLLSLPSF